MHATLVGPSGPERTASVADFVRQGLARGEAVSIGVPDHESETLRQALGARKEEAAFFDVVDVGRNPGRIIPVMLDFAAAHAGRRVRFVSQPFWAAHSAADTLNQCGETSRKARAGCSFTGENRTPSTW
jgi:hypothetical protein